MRRLALAFALVTTAALAAPSLVLADAARDAIHTECQEGRIDGNYSQKQYRNALRNIQADLDQYTDCRDVIRRAQLDAAGKGSSGSKGGGSAADGSTGGGDGAPPVAPTSAGETAAQILAQASPAEQAAVTKAVRSSGDVPIVVGDEVISPNSLNSPAGAANALPAPLVVVLVLLGLGLAAGSAQTLRSLVDARRTPAT